MEPRPSDPPLILHASCVALNGRGILIRGASGTGKSSLALQLMGLGASLVADDRVWLFEALDDRLMARAPGALKGLIEARGVGILRAGHLSAAAVRCIVDLDQTETDRLPLARQATLKGRRLPLLHAVSGPHFPAAIAQFVRYGTLTH